MNIFISYRRADSGGIAGRLFDHLQDRFPDTRVFIDVASIRGGEDFVARIGAAVAEADAVLVLIGRSWFGGDGADRLAQSEDLLRIEVAEALRQQKRVIPVLVEGAQIPERERLPGDIRKLSSLTALPLRHAFFGADLAGLAATLGLAADRPRVSDYLAGAVETVVLAAVIFLLTALANTLILGQSMQRTLGSAVAVWVLLAVLTLAVLVLVVMRRSRPGR